MAGPKPIIPWKRFWCRSGEPIHVGDGKQGFLTDPEEEFARLYNPQLGTLDKLLDEKCLILCGDPGIGKSTVLQQTRTALESYLGTDGWLIWLEFRDVPNEAVFSRRTFESPVWKQWQESTGKLVLVVDGVDEGLVKVPGFVAYLTSELRNAPVERLQIILACRSAEWPTSEGQQLIGLWGATEKTPIFELCPLRQQDAEQAATTWGLDSRAFIQAVYQQNVVGLAALPTTLFFLLAEFRESGVFSGTHRELYERGCQQLARENDPRRIETLRALRKTARVSTPDEIHEAACRLAALLLLCGKSAIHIGLMAEADEDSDLHLSEAADVSTVRDGSLTEDVLFDGIASGLFTSHGPHRFGFSHQTFAECLAAQFLSRLPLMQIRRLLCARDSGGEYVIPPLVETAAWVAGGRGDFFDYLCQVEPEALLRSDISKVQNQRKHDLVAAILENAKRADLFDERNFSRFFYSLNHPQLASQLRPYLTDKALNIVVRRIAFSITLECDVSELCDDLLQIVQDVSELQQLRDQAAQTLEQVIPMDRLADLIPLATGTVGPDPDDTIRGSAIRRLVPTFWSVSQAAPYLHAPHNDNFFGSYKVLLKYHLPGHLKDGDVPVMLERLLQKTHCFDTINDFGELAEATFVKALENLSNPEIRRLTVRVWMSKARNYHLLPHTKESGVVKFLQEHEDIRRAFIAAIVNDPSVPLQDLIHLHGSPLSLDLQGGLEWALHEISRCPAERRTTWASVIRSFSQHPEAACKCWDLLLQRISEIPELASEFSWLRAWSLDEPGAQKAKEDWLGYKRLEQKSKRRESVADIKELLKQDFDDIAAGKTSRWINLCHHLSVGQNQSRITFPFHHDLTEYPGWKHADEGRRRLIRGAARSFLINHTDGYAQLGGRTNFCDAGYIAMWLLRNEIKNDGELKVAVATNWIDALISRFNGGSEHYQETTALAYELNPDATLRGFVRELKEDDRQHGQIVSLHGFRKAWDARFTAAALDLIQKGTFKASSIESVLQFVAPIAPVETASCAKTLLNSESLAMPAKAERNAGILAACLGGMPATAWDFAWPIIETDSSLAEKVITRIADRINYDRNKFLPLLTERQLADLYLKVHDLFPPESDPPFHGGVVSSRQSIVWFRGNIIGVLEARGTEEACCELLRLANTLPRENLWMRWRWYSARTGKRRKSWVRPAPKTVLTLVARGEARLVNDAGDLKDVVMESLNRLQIQLTSSTLPRSEDLWHWDGADTRRRDFRPHDEAHLSNYIARWLRDDLEQRGIVIAREVQLRQGQRTDIYVSAVPRENSLSQQNVTVVVEVKGCWNAETRTAINTQLVGDYLRLNGLTYGIYLVGWFLCAKWNNPQNRLTSKTFEAAQEEVKQLAAAYDGKANPECVSGLVLDCRYPESDSR